MKNESQKFSITENCRLDYLKNESNVQCLWMQIAGLKAALAKREGERQQLHRSRSSSPERIEVQSGLSMQLSWEGPGHVAISHRQPMEDVGNIEVWTSKSRILTNTNSFLTSYVGMYIQLYFPLMIPEPVIIVLSLYAPTVICQDIRT